MLGKWRWGKRTDFHIHLEREEKYFQVYRDGISELDRKIQPYGPTRQ